ncbi:hypothetical protein PEM37_39250 [Streptomyces sp. AD681]|uniref:hypothetical protein n=1 Tax=Streptomyces sp. AD681 TaxID=3019069 RepID=UPI0022F16E80|nr:hypothetical protein [Streptomyces sp. AD681]MDA5147539.1 hypothetical protein [Streptomyces sp. AD681]
MAAKGGAAGVVRAEKMDVSGVVMAAKGGIAGVAVAAAVVVVVTGGAAGATDWAVARWTGRAGAPPSVAEDTGAGDRAVSEVVSRGGVARGAPSGERRAGAAAGPAGGAVDAGAGAGACAGDCAAVGADATVGRTAPTGPDEVGAPSPGRRPAALRCTGAVGAADLPVCGGDSGTAGVGALRVPGVAGEAGVVGAVTVVAGIGPSGTRRCTGGWCRPSEAPSAADTVRWTGGPAGPAVSAPGVGEDDGEGAAVPPAGGVPVPVPVAGSVAGRGSARRTGAVAACAASEAVPDAGVTGRTGARGPDSGRDTARCTGAGAPVVVASGEPVRRSPAEAGRSDCAAARRGAAVSLPAGEGAPPSARRTARCTGGVEAAAPLPAGAVDAGPPLPAASAGADPDGRVVARWTGGVPGPVPPLAGAGVGGLLLPDGRAVVRWTGVAVGVVPTSGAVAAGLPLLGGAGVRRTGLSAAVPLSAGVIAGLPLPGCAGEPDGRVVARWTGGVPGAVPLLAGAGVGGLLSPDGRVVARWTGVVLPLGAVVAGLLSPGRAVPRPAGVSVGEGLDGWAAVRWTGGVPDAEPP